MSHNRLSIPLAEACQENAALREINAELLAALKRFVSGTPCVISDGGIWCNEHMSQVPCCVAVAHAAIKRAEGK